MGNISQEQTKVLIFAEREGPGFASITFGSMEIGRKIATQLKGRVAGAVLGHKKTIHGNCKAKDSGAH